MWSRDLSPLSRTRVRDICTYTGISLKSWRSPFARLSCFFEKGCTAPKRGSYIFRRAADTKRLTTTSATRTASSFLLFFVLPELIPSTLSLSHCRVCTCTGSCTANANSMFLQSKYVRRFKNIAFLSQPGDLGRSPIKISPSIDTIDTRFALSSRPDKARQDAQNSAYCHYPQMTWVRFALYTFPCSGQPCLTAVTLPNDRGGHGRARK